MLYKLWRSFIKEIQLLKRDSGGIVIIFLMPLLLIITITLIQDSTFKILSKTPDQSSSYLAVAEIDNSANSPRSYFSCATIAIIAALSVVYSNFGM